MPQSTTEDHLAKRYLQETNAAQGATDPAVRQRHHVMAETYRRELDDASTRQRRTLRIAIHDE